MNRTSKRHQGAAAVRGSSRKRVPAKSVASPTGSVVKVPSGQGKFTEAPWPTRSATFTPSHKLLSFAYETKPVRAVHAEHFSRAPRAPHLNPKKRAVAPPVKTKKKKKTTASKRRLPAVTKSTNTNGKARTGADKTLASQPRSSRPGQKSSQPRRLHTRTVRATADTTANEGQHEQYSVGDRVLVWERFCKEWLRGTVLAVTPSRSAVRDMFACSRPQ